MEKFEDKVLRNALVPNGHESWNKFYDSVIKMLNENKTPITNDLIINTIWNDTRVLDNRSYTLQEIKNYAFDELRSALPNKEELRTAIKEIDKIQSQLYNFKSELILIFKFYDYI